MNTRLLLLAISWMLNISFSNADYFMTREERDQKLAEQELQQKKELEEQQAHVSASKAPQKSMTYTESK